MNLGMGLANIVSLFKAGPSEAQLQQQAATGGGNEQVRDRLVKDDKQRRSLHLTGQRVATRKMLDKAGVTKPAASKRM